jgi:hypothetical protein
MSANLKFDSKTILEGMTGMKFETGTPVSLLRRGDLVRVMEGDQKNLKGHVFSIDPKTNTLKLRPDIDQLRNTLIDFKVTEVQKLVYAGDHVKVKGLGLGLGLGLGGLGSGLVLRFRFRFRFRLGVKVRG